MDIGSNVVLNADPLVIREPGVPGWVDCSAMAFLALMKKAKVPTHT
jgi:hypothetical protein